MALLVPASVFANAKLTDTVYLYSRFGGDIIGGSADTDADAGFEEWTVGKGKPVAVIPEPSSLLVAILGSLCLLARRKR
jgi:hypothetical protein